MSISSINRVKTIAIRLVRENAGIATIYSNNDLTIGNELIPGHKIISFNCFVKNLKAYINIQGLPEISLPQFTSEDSETDKVIKTLDIEWTSPRKQLSLYLANSGDWVRVGSISLLNPSSYPYRVHNLMDLFTDNLAIELGDNGRIGIKVDDVGYGLLNAEDEVVIHGSYLEEIFVSSRDLIYIPLTPTPAPQEPEPTPSTKEDTEMTNWIITASDYTAKVGEKILALTETNEVTVTLPSNPAIGAIVKIAKYSIKNSESRNSVIINLNNAYLDGATPTNILMLSIGNIIEFIYIDSNTGWTFLTSPLEPTVIYN